ncbi:dolichyl-diphosphooligosaccharide--protein glycosyltransferase subunit DAD1 isoform X2 [Gossypium hirsutum]|uniref:Dolichyl-diphosphooligosaccharide--protein glycosyltransferase subunit DAD1 n=1 Tax=Gossypium hirsutum TaxID=3635 RepID=A0ABM3B030_GOSHI|nr:dolichyl-diphosphooligosaccharide--protein glycosyltransferase subunit DAD1-like isoform X2 [Gossypium hirsutum]
MGRTSSTKEDAGALFHSLRSAYAATLVNLKIIDLYVGFAIFTALIQVVYMAMVGSFPFNSFLSGVLSCVGTAVLAVCLRIQVNKENKEFKIIDLYVGFAIFTALIQVVYMAMVGSFPFNSFLSGVLSCVGTAVLAGKSNFLSPLFAKDLPPERAFADFVLCNLVLHLVIMNFLG